MFLEGFMLKNVGIDIKKRGTHALTGQVPPTLSSLLIKKSFSNEKNDLLSKGTCPRGWVPPVSLDLH